MEAVRHPEIPMRINDLIVESLDCIYLLVERSARYLGPLQFETFLPWGIDCHSRSYINPKRNISSF